MKNFIKISLLLTILSLILLLNGSGIKKSPKKNTPKPPIEFMEVPSYVNLEANYIHYKDHLKTFYDKLSKLKKGEIEKVHILHIGDSHLQAGHLPGELRYLLQATFGNAGRGLVFPYQLAKTNGPYDLTTQSNIEWECSRNITYNHDVPVGLCGYSMRTTKKQFEVEIKLKNKEDYFDKISILGSSTDDIFDLHLKGFESDNKLNFNKIPFKAGSCFLLDEPKTGLIVSGVKPDNHQGNYVMQGVLLENTRNKGILYSCAGVNGATYYAYNRSADFMEQLEAIEPDLVIISLGTNEAAAPTMSAADIQKQLLFFLDNLKNNSSCKSVLVVTPPDIFLRGKIRTKNSLALSEMMHDVAKAYHKIAIWDFYEVMGGYGSIDKWFNSNLAAGDRIHYTVNGYRLQAQLLFKALFKNEIK